MCSLRRGWAGCDLKAIGRGGILVNLTSRELRRSFIEHKRKKGTLLCSDVSSELGSGRVYVNESLPLASRRLLAEAKKCVREGRWERAWTRDRIVFVRGDASSRPVRVDCPEDLCVGQAITALEERGTLIFPASGMPSLFGL